MKEGERVALVMWDCGSPLYDSFELASVSHLIERHTMVLPAVSSSSTTSFKSSSSSVSSDSWSRPSVSTASEAAKSDTGLGNRGGKSWWELCPKKRKLQDRWDTLTTMQAEAKKSKTSGCFGFGFFK